MYVILGSINLTYLQITFRKMPLVCNIVILNGIEKVTMLWNLMNDWLKISTPNYRLNLAMFAMLRPSDQPTQDDCARAYNALVDIDILHLIHTSNQCYLCIVLIRNV